MISTGIFTGYYPFDIDETIRRIKKDGFSCVQLDVSFKDCDAAKEYLKNVKEVSSGTPDDSLVKEQKKRPLCVRML